MRIRAGVILLQNRKLALIERYRAGLHYFSIPGGGVEAGESPEQAAVREAHEELGVTVALQRLVAEITYRGAIQYYYLGRLLSGKFGTGMGLEMQGGYPPESGTYSAIWLPVDSMGGKKIFPPTIARLVRHAIAFGWPEEIIRVDEGA